MRIAELLNSCKSEIFNVTKVVCRPHMTQNKSSQIKYRNCFHNNKSNKVIIIKKYVHILFCRLSLKTLSKNVSEKKKKYFVFGTSVQYFIIRSLKQNRSKI